DPALVVELVALPVTLVLERDLHALVQEGELAESLREDVECELVHLENQRVGLEGDLRAALLCRPDFLESPFRRAAPIALEVNFILSLDLDFEILGERIHDGDTDAVETTGNAIGALVELATGVEFRQHDLGSGDLFGGVNVDRNAAAVVVDRHAALDVDRHVDAIAVPTQGLVDRVVDDLENQVVE